MLYECDAINHPVCSKTFCHLVGGECTHTIHVEFSRKGKNMNINSKTTKAELITHIHVIEENLAGVETTLVECKADRDRKLAEVINLQAKNKSLQDTVNFQSNEIVELRSRGFFARVFNV